jgi:hypothetical protein
MASRKLRPTSGGDVDGAGNAPKMMAFALQWSSSRL